MGTRSTAADDLSARSQRLADAGLPADAPADGGGDGSVEPLDDPWFDMTERTIVARAEGGALPDAPGLRKPR